MGFQRSALPFLQPSSVVSMTLTYRDSAWKMVPSNLVVAGDIVALKSGDEAPARVECIDPARGMERVTFERGEVLSLPHGAQPASYAQHMFLMCSNMRRFRVLETPLQSLLARLLHPAPRPQTSFSVHLARFWHAGVRVSAALVVLSLGAGVMRALVWRDMSVHTALVTNQSAFVIMAGTLCLSWMRIVLEALGACARADTPCRARAHVQKRTIMPACARAQARAGWLRCLRPSSGSILALSGTCDGSTSTSTSSSCDAATVPLATTRLACLAGGRAWLMWRAVRMTATTMLPAPLRAPKCCATTRRSRACGCGATSATPFRP